MVEHGHQMAREGWALLHEARGPCDPGDTARPLFCALGCCFILSTAPGVLYWHPYDIDEEPEAWGGKEVTQGH